MSTIANRNKTVKKTNTGETDLSGNSQFTPLMNFLKQESDNAFKRPWHRLERGLRMNRLRKFSEDEAKRLKLSEPEKNNLFILLNKSLEKKLLNSKTAVIYDLDEEKIMEIKGLVSHRTSTGDTLFQLLDRKNAVTFRRRPQPSPAVLTSTSTSIQQTSQLPSDPSKS
jgi:hypothetical protein